MTVKEALTQLKIINCPGWGSGIPYITQEQTETHRGNFIVDKLVCGRAVNIRDTELPKACRICPARRNSPQISSKKV